MGIMRALRATKKAALAVHRWLMKYSGTTMIIDNIEERRRRRQSEEHSEADSGASSERDSPSQKQETGPNTQSPAVKDSPAGSTGLVLGSTEENKKVLG